MYANLALPADLLRYSKGIIDGKLNEKNYFLSAMLIKKNNAFYGNKNCSKKHYGICFSFFRYIFYYLYLFVKKKTSFN